MSTLTPLLDLLAPDGTPVDRCTRTGTEEDVAGLFSSVDREGNEFADQVAEGGWLVE